NPNVTPGGGFTWGFAGDGAPSWSGYFSGIGARVRTAAEFTQAANAPAGAVMGWDNEAGGGGTPGDAAGAMVTANASLVSSSATGAAAGAGALLAATAALLAGMAAGAASVGGNNLPAAAFLLPGTATGA